MTLRTRSMAPTPLLLASLVVAACAPPPPPAPTPPVKTEAPSPPPPPPEPEPTASAEADKPPEADPEQPKSSGMIPVLKSDPEEITDSFGLRPAKLEIGESERATLRIPENALTQGVNITFKIDKKGKALGKAIGTIYRLSATVPPASAPSKVETSGPAFELSLPAGDKKDANLAIGELSTDDNGRQKLQWTVIAPTKIDDATSTAHFEIKALVDGYLHVTTKAPTPPPAP